MNIKQTIEWPTTSPPLDELAKAFAHGEEKHGAGDWRTAYDCSLSDDYDHPQVLAKVMRHLVAGFGWVAVHSAMRMTIDIDHERIDAESGVTHLAKAAANLLIADELERTK